MAGTVQPTKPASHSLTIIFNVLSLAVVFLGMTTPMVNQFVKDPTTANNVKDLFSAVIAVVNILLRFRTDQAIRLG